MKLEKAIVSAEYAAGSALACIDGRLYLMGDNMGYLQVLDAGLNVTDTIRIVDTADGPIPKPTKPDIEAATTVCIDGAEMLLLIGSGSLAPYRSGAWLVNTRTREKAAIDLNTFYSRLKAQGVTDLNIEGAASGDDFIVLSARGNNATPVNHLIFTSATFWKEQETAPIIIKTVTASGEGNGLFSGVSGLEYSKQSDCLVMTVSTENTASAYEDGAIGKSYLWLVNDLSKKRNEKTIVADQVIDMEAADAGFRGQKIESACIVSETLTEIKLALAADNDDGKTALFLVSIQK